MYAWPPFGRAGRQERRRRRQNVHHEQAGAYTGEISASMLAGLATWVILAIPSDAATNSRAMS